MLKKVQSQTSPGSKTTGHLSSRLQSQVLCCLCRIGKAHGVLRKAFEKASCFSLQGHGYERQSCAPTCESTRMYQSATAVLVFAPVQAWPPAASTPLSPGLHWFSALSPGGSRERRTARGQDLLLLLVASAAAPLAAQPRWCAPAAGGDVRPRPSGQQQCPPYCRARGLGQPLNICCVLKWGRGLAGEQTEARSSVCASFMKRLLLVMVLSLPNVSHVLGFSKNPEKVGEGLLGSPCRGSDYSML